MAKISRKIKIRLNPYNPRSTNRAKREIRKIKLNKISESVVKILSKLKNSP